MASINGVDTVEFGREVERLCDYLLNQLDEKDGSRDTQILQDLKEKAADLQFGSDQDMTFAGLADYVRGVPE